MRKICLGARSSVFRFLAVLGATPAAPKREWKQLFNGKDLTLETRGPGGITVEDGLMKLMAAWGLTYCERRKNWPLQNSASFSRCAISTTIPRLRPHPHRAREPWMPVHYGYEVQIDNQSPETSKEDDYHITAARSIPSPKPRRQTRQARPNGTPWKSR